jgi:hypothetical protein
MRPKELMKKFLTASAAHHAEMAAAHQTSADDFEKGSSEHTFHSAAAKSHLTAGEESAACCQECMKADFGELSKAEGFDWDALIPTRISAIAPEAPANVRAIPRAGAPNVPRPNVGTPTDAASLVQKITQVEE